MLGYDISGRIAQDPVYGGISQGGQTGVEFRIAKRTWLAGNFSLGSGPMVRYEMDSTTATSSEPGTTPSTVFADDQVAVQIRAVVRTATIDLERGLFGLAYVRGVGGISWLEGDGETSVAHFAQVSVGVRLP
jgi:hypothetical protein